LFIYSSFRRSKQEGINGRTEENGDTYRSERTKLPRLNFEDKNMSNVSVHRRMLGVLWQYM